MVVRIVRKQHFSCGIGQGFALRVLFLLLFGLILGACSDLLSDRGNSAESGNPEMAGLLTLEGGAPAKNARVQCVPAGYNALRDSVLDSRWQTFTDSLGNYSLKVVPEGNFSLEAYHVESGMRLLLQNLAVKKDSTLAIAGELTPTGTARIGASPFENGTSGYVYVIGTSILRSVKVKFGAIFVDSLPADQLDLLVFIADNGDSLTLDSALTVDSGDTVNVLAPLISLTYKVPLNTTSGGANITDTLFGFPLVMRLDSSLVDFSVIGSISGTWTAKKADGTVLPLQLAKWDNEAKSADFWVRLDTLLPQSTTDTLFFTFQEGTASVADDPIFNAANGFIAVWHFEDGANIALDATGNGYAGVGANTSVGAGAIGSALRYNGLTSYMSIPRTAEGELNFAYDDTMSISVWVHPDILNTSRFVYGKGVTQYHLKYLYPDGWLFERYKEQTEGSARYWYKAPLDTIEDTGKWDFLTVVQVGTIINLYRKDSLITSSPAIGTFENAYYTSNDFEIGRQVFPLDVDSTGQYFWGAIDELHISKVARSVSWVRATYLNQRPVDAWPTVIKEP